MGYEEIPPTLIESTLFYSHGGGLSVCLHQAQASSIHANGVTLFGVVFSFLFYDSLVSIMFRIDIKVFHSLLGLYF